MTRSQIPFIALASWAVVVVSIAPGRAQPRAQSAPSANIEWTVQVDPLTAALGIAQVLFERRVSPKVAVYAGPSLRLYDSPLTKDEEEGYRAHGVEMGARWFFRGTAPRGLWAGVRAVVARMSFEGESRVGGYVSALGGKAWVLRGRWVLSAAIGVSYFDYQIGGVGVDGVLPAAHTGVGVAF